MNEVSRTALADTPAMRLRESVESTGFTIEGLRDDLTRDQVVAVAESLLDQLKADGALALASVLEAAAERSIPATDAERNALGRVAKIAGFRLDPECLQTRADVSAMAAAIGRSVAADRSHA